MEIIAEILLQIVGWLFQFLGELLLQGIAELFAEFIGHSIKEPFRRPSPIHPWLAAIGYAFFGALAGAISLWLLPTLFITSHGLRLFNLFLTPLLAGLLMAWLGAWRQKRQQEIIRLDRFSYGFCFALAMAVVRFTWGG
jgi:hypothetical protein